MTPLRNLLWTLAMIFAGGGAAPVVAAEALWSIEQFNDAEPNWPRILGTPLRIEGRLSSQLKGQMRFQKCDVTFRLPADLERKIASAKNLEVAGALRYEGNRYYFDVTDLKSLPTDRERYQAREVALRNAAAKEWFELGEWALGRGKFYDDQELLDLGRTSLARGLALAVRELPKGDVDGRFALVDKAVELQFPPSLVDEIRHEAFREWLARCLMQNPPDEQDLAALEARLAKTFPEAVEPLSAWPTDLTQSYTLDPIDTYRLADAGQRKILHRLLGADVQWRRIVRSANPDGSNGGQIADRIDQLIPERHAAAEQYRERELVYRMQGIDTAPRAEALTLAAAFRERKRPQLATETLLKWLVAKERRLRPDEAPQFIELADDYLTLLNDEPRAVALLAEAHRREPQSQDVLDRFSKLGFRYDGVRWTKARPVDAPGDVTDPAPEPAAIPQLLKLGMTAAELGQLLNQPTSVTLMRTAAGTDEIRVYGRHGEGSRMVVHLRGGPGATEPRVTKFYTR